MTDKELLAQEEAARKKRAKGARYEVNRTYGPDTYGGSNASKKMRTTAKTSNTPTEDKLARLEAEGRDLYSPSAKGSSTYTPVAPSSSPKANAKYVPMDAADNQYAQALAAFNPGGTFVPRAAQEEIAARKAANHSRYMDALDTSTRAGVAAAGSGTVRPVMNTDETVAVRNEWAKKAAQYEADRQSAGREFRSARGSDEYRDRVGSFDRSTIPYGANNTGRIRYALDDNFRNELDTFNQRQGLLDSTYENLKYLNDFEKNDLANLVAQGDYGRANEYLDHLQPELNARMQGNVSAANKKLAEEQPVAGVLANIVGTREAGMALLPTIQGAINEEMGVYKPVDTNGSAFRAAHLLRDTEEGIGNAAYNAAGGGTKGEIARTLAQAGLSAAQNASMLPMGGTAPLVFMGSMAAGQSALDTLENGGTAQDALKVAVATGIIETATEKIGIDNFFRISRLGKKGIQQLLKDYKLGKPLVNNIKSFAGDLGTQMAAEGAEEMISEVAGNLADTAIRGDNGQYAQLVQNYMANGMSEEQAKARAFTDMYIDNVLKAGAQGALAGGMLGVGGATIGTRYNNEVTAVGAQLAELDITPEQLISAVQQSGSKDAQDFARELSRKLVLGQEVTLADMGQLHLLSNNYITSKDYEAVQKAAIAEEESRNAGGNVRESEAAAEEQQGEPLQKPQNQPVETQTATKAQTGAIDVASKAANNTESIEPTAGQVTGEAPSVQAPQTTENAPKEARQPTTYEQGAQVQTPQGAGTVVMTADNTVAVRLANGTTEIFKTADLTATQANVNENAALPQSANAQTASGNTGANAETNEANAEGRSETAAQSKTVAETSWENIQKIVQTKAKGGLSQKDEYTMNSAGRRAFDRIGRALGVEIHFVDRIVNEEGEANGLYQNGHIFIARNAENPYHVVLAHEITHHFEKTAPDVYEKFKSAALKMNPGLVEKYMAMWGYDEATAEFEVAADFAGELLEKEGAVKRIIKEDISAARGFHRAMNAVFDKVRRDDTKGLTEEEKKFDAQLDAARDMWRRCLRETRGEKAEFGIKAGETEPQFSISRTRNMSWEEQMTGLFSPNKANTPLKSSDTLYVGITPDDLNDVGVSTHPLVVPLSVVTKARKAKRGSASAHQLSVADIKKTKHGVYNAVAQIYSADRNAVIYITPNKSLSNGIDRGNIVVSAKVGAKLNAETVNEVTSIHPRNSIEGLLNNLGKGSVVKVIDKKKFDEIRGSNRIYSPELLENIKLIVDTISQPDEKSKPQASRKTEDFEKEYANEETRAALFDLSGRKYFDFAKEFYGKYQDGEADEHNFFYNTIAEFQQMSGRPHRAPDHVSRGRNMDVSSEYWYTKDGVIRGSTHWGMGIASCDWALHLKDGGTRYGRADRTVSHTNKVYAKAKWSDFVFKTDTRTIEGETDLASFRNTVDKGVVVKNGKVYEWVRGYGEPGHYEDVTERYEADAKRNADDPVDRWIAENAKYALDKAAKEADEATAPQMSRKLSPEQRKLDEDYMAAVERGDMETAQRMVDEAAKAAGYTVEGYHGTDAEFNEFKIGDIGYHIGTEGQANARIDDTGLRSTQNNRKPHVMRLYANIQNPLHTAFDFGDWHGKNVAEMLLQTEQWEEGYDENAEEINARLEEIARMPDGAYTDKTLREYLQSLGYDGIEYENQFEDVNRGEDGWDDDYDLSYIAFSSSQLKRADPATYDDNGNVIPLSERFNEKKDDIRFSRKGQTLSPDFKRWFGDWENDPENASKVVNEDGTPKVVYHGTLHGGFNVFGGRHDFWYFADSKDYARVFAGLDENGEYASGVKESIEKGDLTSQIYEAYLNVRNPFVTEDADIIEDALYWDSSLAEKLREKGYDALMLKDMSQIIVLKPEQIKSATDNVGTFDRSNPDIRFSRKGQDAAMRRANRLARENARLKGQFKLTKGVKLRESDIRKVTRELLKDYTSSMDAKVLEMGLGGLYEQIINETDDERNLALVREYAEHLAKRLVDDALVDANDYNKDAFQNVKSFVTKENALAIPDDVDEEWLKEFRDKHKGRIGMKRKGRSVAEAYKELSEEFPIFFPEDTSDTKTQLETIGDVLESLDAIFINPHSNALEDAYAEATIDIMNRVAEVREEKARTPAEEAARRERGIAEARLNEQKARSEERLEAAIADTQSKAEAAETANRIADARKYRERIARLEARLNKLKEENKGLKDKARQTQKDIREADTYYRQAAREERKEERKRQKEAEEAARRARRDAVNEALRQARENREKAINDLKDKYKAKTAEARERQNARDLRKKIEKYTKDLYKTLAKPTNEKHINEDVRPAAALLISLINQESNFETDPATGKRVSRGGATRKAQLAGVGLDIDLPNILTKRTEAARKMRKAAEEIFSGEDNYLLIYDPELMENLAIMEDWADKPLATMSSAELQVVWDAVRGVKHMITQSRKVFNEGRQWEVGTLASGLVRDVDLNNPRRTIKYGAAASVDKLLNIDQLTPQAFFHRFGEGGDRLFRMLRRSQDKYVRIIADIQARTAEVIKDIDIDKLNKDIATYKVKGGDVTLSRAQVLLLYASIKREQAAGHILGGGIKAKPLKGKGLFETKQLLPVEVTQEDLDNMFKEAKLTEAEKKAADGLVNIMSTVLAEYGNEASLRTYGYAKFREGWYVPIETDPTSNKTDNNDPLFKQFTAAASIAGRGFAKQTKEGAKNAIMVGSLFDVYAKHVNDMAMYAAYVETLENMRRVRNFKFEDGTKTQNYIEALLTKSGVAYWDKLIRDINGGERLNNDDFSFDRFVGAYKAAAVSANIRVILQQPTAIIRAAAEINPAYLISAMRKIPKRHEWDRVKKNSAIAQWKDWGYFDINTGRQMRDVVLGTDSLFEKFKQAGMRPMSGADSFAWTLLYHACEDEAKAKGLRPGSAAFDSFVASRFSDIIDKTQVVDGVLQRSQIMRSTNAVTKMATSFMAEPTKTYNMFLSAVWDFRHARSKTEKQAARKKLGFTVAALVVSFLTNAAAQSLIDALRDDDRDKEFLDKFWDAYLGRPEEDDKNKAVTVMGGNLWTAFNPVTYIPFFKDIVSLVQGFDTKRMDMESIGRVIDAAEQALAAARGEGKQTAFARAFALASEVSRVFGLPLANIKRDSVAVLNTIAQEKKDYDMMYKVDRAFYKLDKNVSRYVDIMLKAHDSGDTETEKRITDDLHAAGVDDKKIKDAADKIRQKQQNVDSVTEIKDRYRTYSEAEEYGRLESYAKSTATYKSANAKERSKYEALLNDALANNSDAQKRHEKAQKAGVSDNLYMEALVASQIADRTEGNNNWDKSSKPSQPEAEAAIDRLAHDHSLSQTQKYNLWMVLTAAKTDKNNPYK